VDIGNTSDGRSSWRANSAGCGQPTIEIQLNQGQVQVQIGAPEGDSVAVLTVELTGYSAVRCLELNLDGSIAIASRSEKAAA
jgi:hypothetical protein